MGFQFTRYCFTRSRIFRLSTFFFSPCWLHLQKRLWALDCGKMTNEFCTYSSTSVISSWTKNSTDSSSNSSALLSSSSVSIPTAKWNKKTPQDLITDENSNPGPRKTSRAESSGFGTSRVQKRETRLLPPLSIPVPQFSPQNEMYRKRQRGHLVMLTCTCVCLSPQYPLSSFLTATPNNAFLKISTQ